MSAPSEGPTSTSRMKPGDVVAATLLAIALVSVAIVVTPQATRPEIEIPGFMAVFAGAMVVIDLVLAVLLFSKGAIGRRTAPIRLGTAYLFAAFIIMPHVAAFPGAIMPYPLIGSGASAVWLWSFWHAGFALAIIRQAVSGERPTRSAPILRAVGGAALAAGALALLATRGQSYLPSALDGRAYFTSISFVPMAVFATTAVALVLVCVRLARQRAAEDLWLAVAMLAAAVDVWLTFRAGSRFSLGWYTSRVASLLTSMVVLVSLLRDIIGLYSQVAVANDALRRLVRQDGLTGLANRRHMDDTLAMEWRRAQRDAQPISFLLLDVDHFKRFNDTYGHVEGDECLRRLAERLGGVARRPGDVAARYGGEEFALVLPATGSDGAAKLAHELLSEVRQLAIPHSGSAHGVVTVSVGVATLVPQPGQDPALLLAAADTALYQAKAAGRGQVRSARPGQASGVDHRAMEGLVRFEERIIEQAVP